jgi:hypothetical protein
MHMTLKHIIELSGRSEKLPQALSCPQAQSLFEAVPYQRSCADACVDPRYCACTSYKKVPKYDDNVLKIASTAIDLINNELSTRALDKDGKPFCAFRKLSRVIDAEVSQDVFDANTIKEHVYYHFKFVAAPHDAEFEITVKYWTKTSDFKVSKSDISRANSYNLESKCVEEKILKSFCYCNDLNSSV